MVTAASLGDVVQQHRDVKFTPGDHLVNDLRGDWRDIHQVSLLDLEQDTEHDDGVFVDGVDVIHVVLHLRDDTPEIRDKTAENLGLVHPPQGPFGTFNRGQHLQEQAVCLGVAAHTGVNAFQVLCHQPQDVRVKLQVLGLGDVEHADQIDRVLLEDPVIDRIEALAIELEVTELPVPAPQAGKPQPRPALVLSLDRRAEDPGQIADILGGQIIVLHEAFDSGAADVVGIAEQAGDLALQVDGQPFLGPPREIMQMAADGPELLLRLGEKPGLGERQHALIDQSANLLHLVDVFADPEQFVQIAQAALALLDVGLNHIT